MKYKVITAYRVIVAAVIAATIAAAGAVCVFGAFADNSSLFEAPRYVEGLPMLYVGETMQLSLDGDSMAMSDNTSVARVSSSGKVTAVGYGKANIDVISESGESSFTLVVKDRYENAEIVSQRSAFPSKQGDNGFYVYNSNNGDIENDLALGLTALGLMGEQYSTGTGWWNNISFIGNDHFGGRGAGALSFKATYPGNYTADYSAWLLESLRTSPDYNSWNIDGFSTGIAKKTADGRITVLVSNIGTKQSVVAEKTRYQTGSVTVDLDFGDEVMMFFCSNGNGDCDEVYTEFFVKTNAITGTPLYVLPTDIERFDGDIKLNVGGSLELSLREGARLESDESAVVSIVGNKITGVGFGSAEIAVTDESERASFIVFVDKKHADGTVSLSQNLPTKQGENNMYIYSSANPDYNAGLAELTEVPDSASSLTSWSTDNVFVNKERVFCNGTGAVAFEAPVDGTYTVDYYAYLMPELRNNPLYLTDWDTDGFTTGLAKRDGAGTVTPVITNVGTRQSVVEPKTRRQTGTAALELKKGEQILFFFSSNGTPDCDEIAAGFYVYCDTAKAFDGNVSFPAGVTTVNGAAILYVGDSVTLQTSFDGALDHASSADAVATVDANGRITAKGVGSAVITVSDAFKSTSRVVTVRNRPNASDVVVKNDIPNKQGDKNLRVYSGPNGDIEDDLESGLKNIPLMGENYYNAGELSWYNNETFINSAHVFTRGVGILGYTVPAAGKYRLDYLSCLMPDIYNDAGFPTYENCDGFTVGLMCKKANGELTVLASDINTRVSLVADETRMLVKERVYAASAGDELCFFWASNGNGDCDEIYYEFTIERAYESDEERPTEISFKGKSVKLEVGENKTLGFDVKFDHGEKYVWSVDDASVATVADGTVTGVGAGSCTVTLKIGNALSSIVVYVTERSSYTIGSNADVEFKADTHGGDRIYMVRMDLRLVDSSAYSVEDGKVVFKASYLETLDVGEKTLEFFFEGNKITAYLSVKTPSDN